MIRQAPGWWRMSPVYLSMPLIVNYADIESQTPSHVRKKSENIIAFRSFVHLKEWNLPHKHLIHCLEDTDAHLCTRDRSNWIVQDAFEEDKT